MRFPIYWKKVHNASQTLSARGWSDTSLEEATQRAEERLARIVAWFKSDRRDKDLDRYHYVMDDNICEAVVDRIADSNGEEVAVISRNAYGSLVMNAVNVMMIDIDVEFGGNTGLFGFLARLLGSKQHSPEEIEALEVEKIRKWQSEHPDFTFRVYRTAAGLRAFVVNRLFPTVDRSVLEIMESLHSDTLYRDLCISQKCFRARLTPKPWRVGMSSPLDRFPFETEVEEKRFQAWFDEYTAKCKNYAVCRFVDQIGLASPHPTAAQLIDFHDKICCKQDRPLA